MYFSLFPSRSHRSILFFDSRVAVSLPLRRACAEFPLLSSSRSIHRSRLENERDTKVYVTFFLSLFVHFLEKLRSCGNRGKSRRRRRRRQVKVKTGWLRPPWTTAWPLLPVAKKRRSYFTRASHGKRYPFSLFFLVRGASWNWKRETFRFAPNKGDR